jgi:hypothetical protein
MSAEEPDELGADIPRGADDPDAKAFSRPNRPTSRPGCRRRSIGRGVDGAHGRQRGQAHAMSLTEDWVDDDRIGATRAGRTRAITA